MTNKLPLVMIIKCLVSNKEKEKDIANFIIFLYIGLIVVNISKTWSKRLLMKEN